MNMVWGSRSPNRGLRASSSQPKTAPSMVTIGWQNGVTARSVISFVKLDQRQCPVTGLVLNRLILGDRGAVANAKHYLGKLNEITAV